MFARVFDTAKRILSRSPSVQTRSSEVRDTPSTSDTSPATATMVTTRGGTETPGAGAGAGTPRSSARKRTAKRELESLDTPTQVKRQRKSVATPKKKAVQETPPPDVPAEGPAPASEEEVLDTIDVVVRSKDVPEKAEDLPIRRRTSPKVVVAKTSPTPSVGTESIEETQHHHGPAPAQDSGVHTPKQQSGSVYATPATHKQTEASPAPKPRTAKSRTPASVRKSSGRKKTLHADDEPNTLEVTQTTSRLLDEVPSSTYETDHAPLSSQDVAASSPQPKKEHVRFGSEEPTETHDTIPAPASPQELGAPEADEGDDSASDSDEAPEMVTAATATTKVKAAQAEAERALRAQQLEEQAKRQKRAERIAEQQAEKRVRDEKKAKKLARQLAKEKKATVPSDDEDEASGTRPGILGNMKDLPAFLPDSLLETIDDQRPLTPPLQRRGKTEEELRKEKLQHHIKFLERSEKPAKDVKKGKLSVAVLGQQNRVLPPKANRNTRNVRELWLKGRKVEKRKGGKPNFKHTKMERRAHGGGFLRGGDD